MILITVLAVLRLQDPALTAANIEEFLASQVAQTQASLPEADAEGNVLTGVSLSGRTVTHEWETRNLPGTADIARLDRAMLMGCEDEVILAATRLGVRLRHEYAKDDGRRRVLELNAASCGGLRLSSSPHWRVIQSTDRRLQAVDLRSVVEEGDTLTFEMVDARPPVADAPDEAFRIYGYRLDCLQSSSNVQYIEAFDRAGQSLDFSDTPGPERAISAGTVMEAIHGEICDDLSEDEDDRTLDALLRAAWARFDAAAS